MIVVNKRKTLALAAYGFKFSSQLRLAVVLLLARIIACLDRWLILGPAKLSGTIPSELSSLSMLQYGDTDTDAFGLNFARYYCQWHLQSASAGTGMITYFVRSSYIMMPSDCSRVRDDKLLPRLCIVTGRVLYLGGNSLTGTIPSAIFPGLAASLTLVDPP